MDQDSKYCVGSNEELRGPTESQQWAYIAGMEAYHPNDAMTAWKSILGRCLQRISIEMGN